MTAIPGLNLPYRPTERCPDCGKPKRRPRPPHEARRGIGTRCASCAAKKRQADRKPAPTAPRNPSA
jgi:hypothetical protein